MKKSKGLKKVIITSIVLVLLIVGLGFTCVPLFLLLSGYLCIYKKPTLKYYIKIIKIIIEFLFCALLVALFNWIVLGNQYTFGYLITEILRFNFPSALMRILQS